jgi:hypothetical protein
MASYSSQPQQSVPLNTVAQGPLRELYSNEYDFENLFYPRNLNSDTRGHYINFYINVADSTSEQESIYSGYEYVSNTATISGRTGVNSAQSASGETSLGGALLIRKTKRITSAIALYMPETVNVSYNANWQSDSLTDAMGKAGLAADITKTISSAYANKSLSSLAPYAAGAGAKIGEKLGIVGNGATDFALFTQGYALNPRLEVLFKGTDMRHFQFDFLFSPFSAQESTNVENIIKMFRYHQAPEINTNDYGLLFVPPSEFDIDFLKDGQINSKIHQIGTCVLSGMNVDYAPFGWSTFEDGSPTNIRMTLQFMETEIVTKQRVREDNY